MSKRFFKKTNIRIFNKYLIMKTKIINNKTKYDFYLSEITDQQKWLDLHEKNLEKIKGKNVLIVDDTCFTGTTLRTIKEYLLSIGANSVYTYCLYDTRDNKIVDYYSSKLDKIPLYWPWGYEIN